MGLNQNRCSVHLLNVGSGVIHLLTCFLYFGIEGELYFLSLPIP